MVLFELHLPFILSLPIYIYIYIYVYIYIRMQMHFNINAASQNDKENAFQLKGTLNNKKQSHISMFIRH